MLFGIPAVKDARGSGADAADGVVQTGCGTCATRSATRWC